ncbi:MAG: hypothetical protein KZQ88_14815, partial [Candidatus Thiodiazotropha sp. (ex Dulcina madagascariensis)]|nr:hypothetical protein [Candidatus Thiodiazotropha sp. (ex Dulcina madagascariensis)]
HWLIHYALHWVGDEMAVLCFFYPLNQGKNQIIVMISYLLSINLSGCLKYSNHSSEHWVISKYLVKAGQLDMLSSYNNNSSTGLSTFKGARLVANRTTDREGVAPPSSQYSGCADGWSGVTQ